MAEKDDPTDNSTPKRRIGLPDPVWALDNAEELDPDLVSDASGDHATADAEAGPVTTDSPTLIRPPRAQRAVRVREPTVRLQRDSTDERVRRTTRRLERRRQSPDRMELEETPPLNFGDDGAANAPDPKTGPAGANDAKPRLRPTTPMRVRRPSGPGGPLPGDPDYNGADIDADDLDTDDLGANDGAAKTTRPQSGAAPSLAAESRPGRPLVSREPRPKRLALLRHPAWGWLVAVGLAVALGAVVQLSSEPGIDKQKLALFFAHTAQGRFAEAEQVLTTLEAPFEIDAGLRERLEAARSKKAQEASAVATARFAEKKYDEALAAGREAEAFGADGEVTYIVAESMRLSGQPEFGPVYQRFLEHNPEHARRDDAQFWYAEWLIGAGQKDAAKVELNEILARPRSNFRKAAARRLEEIK